MAVEKQKVITRLKALFPKANLSQQRLDAIADKLAKKPADDADDDAIDAVINDFNDVFSIDDIARGDDKVRQLEADKKKAEELAKNKGKNKGEDDDDDDDDDDTAGMTPFEKKVLKTMGGLKTEIETIKNGNLTSTKKQTAQQVFEKSEVLKGMKPEIKERWLSRIDVNSDTPIEEQVTGLEEEYKEIFQSNADNGTFPGAAGGGDTTVNKADDKLVGEMLDNVM